MSDDVLYRLTDTLRDVLGTPDLEVHDGLTADEVDGWDSVTHVELIYALEEEFGIEFPAGEITAHADIGALRRDIEARLNGD